MCIQHFVRFTCGCERNTEFAQCSASRRQALQPYPNTPAVSTAAGRSHKRHSSIKCTPDREGETVDASCPCHASEFSFAAALELASSEDELSASGSDE
ncbi:hypothetical protein EXIGLDRAFT_715865 [Exidia glandulosa HHB12029]|uniref:Uncharacterized protein n=1 Tax=Exidia glandulosa HHB12029 TaxID=1314781 RepID=A0A165QME1_EXIGL|nr:hypothetical protein EXIGLDRAFT_715865 [Exidia glandulosa HHB12029]